MSHILDALRRAEDERRLGTPPDRGMIAGPLRSTSARASRGRRLAITGILLLVAVIVLGYREVLRRGDAPPPPTAASAAPPASPPPEQTVQRPAPQPAVTPANAPPVEAAELPRARLDEADAIEDLDALFAEESAGAPPPATRDRNDTTTLKPRDVLKSASEAPARLDTPAASRASESGDLPSARSAGMPDFTIQVHAWAPQSDERFIRVDGRRLGEGDSLPNGARIANIVRDGVIVEWRGQRLMRRLGR